MNIYMKEAIKEAIKAKNNGEVPVGAIIVKDSKIISRACNMKETSQIATQHAEIIAINKACAKLNTWRLNDCIMYVTMEPCIMCMGAIVQSRLSKIIYMVENDKFGFQHNINWENYNQTANHKFEIEKDTCNEDYLVLIQEFFKEKRSN